MLDELISRIQEVEEFENGLKRWEYYYFPYYWFRVQE
jgi:hypothetical protein